MADDAEAAFLRSMQVANEAVGDYGATGVASEQQPDSSSDEYDPAQAVQADSFSHDTNNYSNITSSTVSGHMDHSHNGNTPQQPSPNTAQSSTTISLPGFAASNALENPSTISNSHTVNGATSQAFVKGEAPASDDDDQGRDTKQSVKSGDIDLNGDTSDLASHSLSNASQLSAADVSIKNEVQDQPPSEVVQNGVSHTVPNLAAVLPDTGASSHVVPTAMPTDTLPAPQVTEPDPSSIPQSHVPPAAAPRARLPHDRIGILEDRIKEDSRGDLDAWLSLISEHRKRGKLNDARTVYERFFMVFPQAVSVQSPTLGRYIFSNQQPGRTMGCVCSDGE